MRNPKRGLKRGHETEIQNPKSKIQNRKRLVCYVHTRRFSVGLAREGLFRLYCLTPGPLTVCPHTHESKKELRQLKSTALECGAFSMATALCHVAGESQ